MKHLIPMTSFIEEQEKIIPYEFSGTVAETDRLFVRRTIGYCRFLKQPLTLGMFVPVDEEGDVLEEPKKEDYTQEELEASYMGIDVIDFQEAKEKVLFKFDSIEPQELMDQFSTIEELANFYEPELTESALKQFLK